MRASRDSITKLDGGRYRVRITVGYDPATGKQMRISRTIRGSRRTAEEERDRMRRECGGATAATYAKMGVYEFVRDEWLPTRKLRPTTLRGYEATLENHIAPAFGNVRMGDLTPLHVTRALSAIERPGAAKNVYKMLRSAMNLAVRSRIIQWNPVLSVDPPVTPDYDAEVYTLEELLDVLDLFRGNEIEAGVIIAGVCGTRSSETCALDWTDLELVRVVADDGTESYRGTADINKGYHQVSGERVTTPTKTKRSTRLVAIPAFAVERLLELRGQGRIGPLMTDVTGERMTPAGFGHRWRKVMMPRTNVKGEVIYSAPVRYIPLKNLRHSKATIALTLGATMHEVSLSLGHVNERTTDTFYNRPEKRADQGVADAFDRGAASARKTRDVGRTGRS